MARRAEESWGPEGAARLGGGREAGVADGLGGRWVQSRGGGSQPSCVRKARAPGVFLAKDGADTVIWRQNNAIEVVGAWYLVGVVAVQGPGDEAQRHQDECVGGVEVGQHQAGRCQTSDDEADVDGVGEGELIDILPVDPIGDGPDGHNKDSVHEDEPLLQE